MRYFETVNGYFYKENAKVSLKIMALRLSALISCLAWLVTKNDKRLFSPRRSKIWNNQTACNAVLKLPL